MQTDCQSDEYHILVYDMDTLRTLWVPENGEFID